MLDINGKLEIVITNKESKYKATSPSFPKCKGFGTTEKEAIQKLSKSISRHISNITNDILKSILLSDSYTEIILDTSKKNKEHRRVFNLDPFNRILSAGSLSGISPDQMSMITKDNKKDIKDFFQQKEMDFFGQESSFAFLDDPVSNNNSQDGFVFGFPVSLN
jgi:predicted RNase H-like HicB family nuclease